jgi:hypothetical protein
MKSTMMSVPLNLSHFPRAGRQAVRGQEIVSRLPDKSLHRYTYAISIGARACSPRRCTKPASSAAIASPR